MDEKDTPQTGTGGGLRYVTETADPNMVVQELPYSCQIACAFQLLKDAGIETTEADLLAEIGYIDGWGSSASSTAKALGQVHPRLGYRGGAVGPENLVILLKRDPWIASLMTDHGTVHAVIVDGLEDELVHVRDPWGLSGPGSESGTRATIRISDFLEYWDAALYNAVFPYRLK